MVTPRIGKNQTWHGGSKVPQANRGGFSLFQHWCRVNFARPLFHPLTSSLPPQQKISPDKTASSVSALFPTLLQQFVLKSPTAFHSPLKTIKPRVSLSSPQSNSQPQQKRWPIGDFPHANTTYEPLVSVQCILEQVT